MLPEREIREGKSPIQLCQVHNFLCKCQLFEQQYLLTSLLRGKMCFIVYLPTVLCGTFRCQRVQYYVLFKTAQERNL